MIKLPSDVFGGLLLRGAVLGALAIAATQSLAWQAGVRANAGVWTDDVPVDASGVQYPLSALLSAGGTLTATDARLYAEGWVGNHAFFAADKSAALREAYAEIPLADGTLRIGRQILPWGRADQINPTDSFVSRNWQWRAPASDDQRFGNDGIEGIVRLGAVAVSGVWMPYMQTTRLPFIDGLQNVAYAAIDGRDNAGLRVDRVGDQVDWGVSFYQGVDLSPSLGASLTALIPRLVWQNDRIQRLGADFAVGLGESTVRGELAYTRIQDRIAPTASSLPGQKADYLKAVLGGDRDLGEGVNVNIQVVVQHLYGSAELPPAPIGPVQRRILATQALVNQQPVTDLYGLAYRVQQRAFNDALRLELSGLAYSAGQGSLVRLRVAYQFDDSLAVVGGANWYRGATDSILGALKPNNTWFMQVQYSL